VLVKRMLRRIFRLKRNEIIGNCKKVNTEEPHKWYSSPNTYFATGNKG
jgi:hypothetical protein